MEKVISDLIISVGVPVSSRGYWYIREAVLLLSEKSDLIMYITKNVYPTIAKKYDTTPCNVEKAIRYSIGKSWEYCISCKRCMEGLAELIEGRKPSNSQFLWMLCRNLWDKLQETEMGV